MDPAGGPARLHGPDAAVNFAKVRFRSHPRARRFQVCRLESYVLEKFEQPFVFKSGGCSFTHLQVQPCLLFGIKDRDARCRCVDPDDPILAVKYAETSTTGPENLIDLVVDREVHRLHRMRWYIGGRFTIRTNQRGIEDPEENGEPQHAGASNENVFKRFHVGRENPGSSKKARGH